MIEINGLTVRYAQLTALDALDLSIPEGEVFGYIGPNGAGKSTTMKILACLLRPTAGRAVVAGLDTAKSPDAIRRLIGYMPDFLGVYDDLTVDEYLQFFASAYDIPRTKWRSLIASVLELTDLTEKRTAMVASLSRGMQQRLGVARVLLHDPKVLLLDEPASGLDPRARIEMRSLLLELRKMGKTIIVSSHILSELGEMCSSIGIIERGKLLFAGTMKEAHARAGGAERISLRVEERHIEVPTLFAEDDRIDRIVLNPDDILIELTPGSHGHHFVIERLVNAGIRIISFTPREQRLEDVFLRITQGKVQ